jgi:flagellar M-ring protein FliF
VPGTLSNTPPQPATAPVNNAPPQPAANAQAPTSRQKDSTVNYEVDKTLRVTQQPMGGVKRLSVAVVVNNRTERDKQGKPVTRALTDAEKAAITDLVKEAMGFDKERGDSLNVVNSAFVSTPPEAIPDVPLWKDPDNIALAKEAGRYLLIIAAIAFLYFKQLKPLLARMREPPKPAVVPTEPILAEDGELLPASPAKASDLELARLAAKEDPRMVANVVKNWVGAE